MLLARFKSILKVLVGPNYKQKQYLVACSGGLDSMVLAHLCHAAGLKIGLSHFNYQLRGADSDLDQQVVQAFAAAQGLPFFVSAWDEGKDLKKTNLQEAAREARYAAFEVLTQTEGYQVVLTAHHAGDNLETMLLQLLKGSGIHGIAAIRPVNGNFVRPLLQFERKFLEQYAIKYGVVWREDESNAKMDYLRNRIRHQVVPLLETLAPQIVQISAQSLSRLHKSRLVYEQYLKQSVLEVQLPVAAPLLGCLNLPLLRTLTDPEGVLFVCLQPFGFDGREAAKLLEHEPGKRLVLEKALLVFKKESIEIHPKQHS